MRILNSFPLILLAMTLGSVSALGQVRSEFKLEIDGRVEIIKDVTRERDSKDLVVFTSDGKHTYSFSSAEDARSFEFYLSQSEKPSVIVIKSNEIVGVRTQNKSETSPLIARDEVLVKLRENERAQGVVLSDRLRVNHDSSIRVVTRISEVQGIRDQMGLAKTAKTEESWVYLPEAGLWIEVGTNEDEQLTAYGKGRGMGVLTDLGIVLKSPKHYREIHQHHIHPDIAARAGATRDVNLFREEAMRDSREQGIELHPETRKNLDKRLQDLFDIHYAWSAHQLRFASIGDLASAAEIALDVVKRYTPHDRRIRFFVCSQASVCEYEPSQRTFDELSPDWEPARAAVSDSNNRVFVEILRRYFDRKDKTIRPEEFEQMRIHVEQQSGGKLTVYNANEIDKIPGVSERVSKAVNNVAPAPGPESKKAGEAR